VLREKISPVVSYSESSQVYAPLNVKRSVISQSIWISAPQTSAGALMALDLSSEPTGTCVETCLSSKSWQNTAPLSCRWSE